MYICIHRRFAETESEISSDIPASASLSLRGRRHPMCGCLASLPKAISGLVLLGFHPKGTPGGISDLF